MVVIRGLHCNAPSQKCGAYSNHTSWLCFYIRSFREMHIADVWPLSSFGYFLTSSILCVNCSSDGGKQGKFYLLIIHYDAVQLERISKKLVQEGLPHSAVLWKTDAPDELLHAIYQAGVQDLQEFLFIQSIVSGQLGINRHHRGNAQ